MLEPANSERYSRQVLLSELGVEGQRKLLRSKVLVVGAGGLGCPVLQYLTAAGVGTLGIIDDDVVAESNLHRQILFGVDDIGKNKAEIAAKKITASNPTVKVEACQQRLTTSNAWDIINQYDVVVDGSDNFSTRYMVNDACVLLNKPLVYGSIFRFEGQVSVFNFNSRVNYRDLYPQQPAEGEVPGCAEAGVLGVLTGIIGSLMANEVIKIVAQMGCVLCGHLLTYNSLSNLFYQIELAAVDQPLSGPANRQQFENMDYGDYCSIGNKTTEINREAFNKLRSDNRVVIVDVRKKVNGRRLVSLLHYPCR